MRFVLGVLVLLLNTLDNTTTFLCLRSPVPGFEVIEANPLARWLFDAVGLTEGLVFEMAFGASTFRPLGGRAIREKMRLAGVSDKAIPLGVTLPVGHVRQEYAPSQTSSPARSPRRHWH